MDFPTEQGRSSGEETFLFGRDGLLRPIWRAVLFALFCLLALNFSARIYNFFFGPIADLPKPAFYGILVGLLLLESWAMLALADRRSFRTLGIWLYSGWWREAFVGISVAAALMGGTIGLLVVTRTVLYQGLAASGSHATRWGAIALLLLLAAASEELLFRGYLLQRLIESVGGPAAVLILSALFGLGHLGNPSATVFSTANTMLVGILLSLAYLRTRALWLPIGLHFAWNFLLGPIFSLPVSGILTSPVLLRPVLNGHAWLTGGAYGPEGGAGLTLICTAGTLWLARTRRIGVSPAMQEALQ
jgi:CAAX protease family protein